MTAGLVERAIGGPDVLAVTLTDQPPLGGPDLVGSVTMRHGRSDPTQQPQPASCQLTIPTARLARLPVIGDDLVVELGADALAWAGLAGADADRARRRFTGRISDAATTPDTDRSPALVALTAVSARSALGRTPIGDVPWPTETDGDRAARILTVAAPLVGAPAGPVDPGSATVLARDVDRQPALQLLDQLAVDTAGALVELRDGTLEWHDADHRRASAPDVELQPRHVIATLRAVQQLGPMLNDLTVIYGVAPPGGQRPSVRLVDQVSVDAHGLYGATMTTQLATHDDALYLCQLVLGRRARPVWQLDPLALDLIRTAGPQLAAQLWGLQYADLARIVGFPRTAAFSNARLWVDGWTETVTRDSWRLQLNVSDYGRTGPPPRWLDMPLGITWADAPADMSWLTAVSWGFIPVSQGRWVDVAADQGWAATPATETYADAAPAA